MTFSTSLFASTTADFLNEFIDKAEIAQNCFRKNLHRRFSTTSINEENQKLEVKYYNIANLTLRSFMKKTNCLLYSPSRLAAKILMADFVNEINPNANYTHMYLFRYDQVKLKDIYNFDQSTK